MAPHLDSPPSSPNLFSQPRPRPLRSPGHSALIRAQNRRRAYLERHGSYFQSSEHELADPLLYDRLIRRFQTPAEREAEGRAKGYARVLEGSLMRGEERLAKLREQTETAGQEEDLEEEGEPGDGALAGGRMGRGGGLGGPAAAAAGAGASLFGAVATRAETAGNGSGSNVPEPDTRTDSAATEPGPEPGTTFSALDAELGPPARTRAEGRAQWEAFLRDRFIRGEDDDFEYARVDDDDEYDVLERREREDAWFDAEDPGWVASDSTADSGEEKVLKGETGVQDF